MAEPLTQARFTETLDQLIEAFPAAFGLFHRTPLRVGIFADLQAALPDLDPALLGQVLARYTGSYWYLKRMRTGAMRVGLDGCPAGCVSESEMAYACTRMGIAKPKPKPQKPAAPKPKAPPKPAPKPQPTRDAPPVKAPDPAAVRTSLAGLRAAAQARRAAQG